MKSIVIIIPYFGKFPNYFDLWLKSCSYNTSVNWLIYTDQNKSDYDVPDNVRFIKTTLGEIKDRASRVMGFEVALDRPYKLCDFKPSYGLIFSEDISEYDYWGYGDVDLIYGNIRKFLTDDILSGHDRILVGGHLSLMRNEDSLNRVFMNKFDGCYYYKDIYTSPKSYTFDEFGPNGEAYFSISKKSGLKIFNKKLYADIKYYYKRLLCDYGGPIEERRIEHKKKKVYFEFSEGKLLQHWGKDEANQKEVLYIHLQKRIMEQNCNNFERFYIYPNEFSNEKKKHFSTFGFSKPFIEFCIRKAKSKVFNRE